MTDILVAIGSAVLVFMLAYLVILAGRFVLGFAQDVRKTRPQGINMRVISEVTGNTRWPNLVWATFNTKQEVREFASGAARFGKGILKLTFVIIGAVVAIVIVVWAWGALGSLSIPGAILVGAVIIAMAIHSKR